MPLPTRAQHAGCRPFVCAKTGGFTLIELMVAIVMVAILIGFAVPSFTSMVNGNRLTSAVNELSAGIQSARMEAIRRSSRVVLCRSDDGLTCNNGAGVWRGWISFVDTNSDDAPDGGVNSLLRVATLSGTAVISASPAVSGNSNLLIVRSDGMIRADDRSLLRANLQVCMPTTYPPENLRVMTIDAGSRVSVARGTGGGACPPPVDP